MALFREIVLEMIERRKDVSNEMKIGWYHRYWASEGKAIGETRTWIN